MSQQNTPIQLHDRDNVLAADPDITWRYGKRPDYTSTNRTLNRQSSKKHAKDTLEYVIQNLVRTFEMEATYKLDPKQWHSIDAEIFRMKTNNGPEYSAEDIIENGTYNLFLGETDVYSSNAEDYESSANIFKEAFTTGFVWEVIEVYSGPPKAVFKWRHWGAHEGKFKDFNASNQLVEVFGITVAEVNEDLKLTYVEHIFDTGQFLVNMTAGGKCPLRS